MNRGVEGAEIELLGVAIAAGLLALLAPAATAALLAVATVHQFLARQLSDRAEKLDLKPLLALGGVAMAGAAFGVQGIVGGLLVWRAGAEIARSQETRGLSEPLWLAIAYRWAPLTAALLFRLGAPPMATLAVAFVACVALGDWALRRLAEWRLGEPQPFDTMAYLGSQARVLALVLAIPDVFASLAAFVTLALARAVEAPRIASLRYAPAL